MLLVGPGDGVVLAVQLQRALTHPIHIGVRRPEATDVHRPDIERGFAADDPFGQSFPGAAAGRDAEGVEPSADIEPTNPWRRAKDEVAVRREALRPIEQLLDARMLQRRHARHR